MQFHSFEYNLKYIPIFKYPLLIDMKQAHVQKYLPTKLFDSFSQIIYWHIFKSFIYIN